MILIAAIQQPPEQISLWPEIIKAAAQSPLGIIALLSLILGSLATAFFRTAPVWARMTIFLVLVVVAVAAGSASLHSAAIDSLPKPPTDGSLSEIPCGHLNRSLGGDSVKISLNVWNDSGQARKLYWLGYDGTVNLMASLEVGDQAGFFTYQNTVWRVDDASGHCLALYRIVDTKSPQAITIKT